MWGADLLSRKQKLLRQWKHLLIPLLPVATVFFALVMFIFWIGGLGEKGKAGAHGHAAAPVLAGGSDRDA